MKSQILPSPPPILLKKTSSFDHRLRQDIPPLQLQKENVGPLNNNFMSSGMIDESSEMVESTPVESVHQIHMTTEN